MRLRAQRWRWICCCCSVARSCPTLCNHELQHTRLPCPSLSPGVCQSSCPLSRWCPPTISSSVGSFSACLQSFAVSGSSPMSWLFTSGGQIIAASASTSVLSDYSGLISFKIDWFCLLAVQGTLKTLQRHHYLKASVLHQSAFFMVQLSHLCMTAGETIALTIRINTTITESWPKWSCGSPPCVTQWSCEQYGAEPPKTDESLWRGLTQCGPVEKGMANQSSMLASRAPGAVWKGDGYICVQTSALPFVLSDALNRKPTWDWILNKAICCLTHQEMQRQGSCKPRISGLWLYPSDSLGSVLKELA